MMVYSLKMKMVCEFIGAFWIVFFGTGAILFDQAVFHIGTISICVAFSLAVSAGILCFVKISGAHFNPVVCVVMHLKGNLSLPELGAYFAAQLAGVVLGSLLLRLIFGNIADLGATLPNAGVAKAFMVEVVLTFVLLIAILSSDFNNRAVYIGSSLLIGLVITFDAIIGGAVSGASMNPVRSLAPAIVSEAFRGLDLYSLSIDWRRFGILRLLCDMHKSGLRKIQNA